MSARRDIPLAVREAQAKASDPATSAFVAANAGAGKTHVLVNRVIRLLLDGVSPEKILCITFTKAAAANMANRVFGTLADWAVLDDDALDERIRLSTGKKPGPPERARARRLQGGDVLLVGGEARFQHLDQQRPFLHGNQRGGEEVVLDALRRIVRIDAEAVRQVGDRGVDAAGVREPRLKRVAVANGVVDDVLEGLVGGNDDGLRQCAAERAAPVGGGLHQHGELQIVEKLCRRRIVEHGEARRDIGLERKLM
jgi:hypothetical protein